MQPSEATDSDDIVERVTSEGFEACKNSLVSLLNLERHMKELTDRRTES